MEARSDSALSALYRREVDIPGDQRMPWHSRPSSLRHTIHHRISRYNWYMDKRQVIEGSETVHFNIHEIRDYYDSNLHNYDLNGLVSIGVSPENADFMTDIGVPEKFDEFIFYGLNDFQTMLIEDVPLIKIGHYTSYRYGLYFKVGCDELFTSSPCHKPLIYRLNKDLKTFFLFHLIRHEISAKMRKEGVYTTYRYALELRKLYTELDPIAMRDVEGYWSHLIEDYETGL